MTRQEVSDAVLSQSLRDEEKYGPYTSAHEGYGVLAEEVAELLEAIHMNYRDGVMQEAIQIAAVAIRIAEACENEAFCKRSGLG